MRRSPIGSSRTSGSVSIARMLAWAAALTLLITSSSALAKTARIKWKEIRGAKEYELEIQKDGIRFKKLELDDPKWKGELPSGVFTYRVRGVDRFKRPGVWSAARPIFIAPPPPRAALSSNSSEIVSYDPNAKVGLKWEPSAKAPAYEVVIKKDHKPIRTELIQNADHLEVSGLASGQYEFQVRPLFNPAGSKGRAPASLQDPSFKGEFSSPVQFTLKRETLRAPELEFPKATLPAPSDRRTVLRWNSVPGASAYQVQIDYLPSSPGQRTWPSRTLRVAETRATVPVPQNGKVSWKVRALASVDPGTHVPAAVGPESASIFTMLPPDPFVASESVGYLAFSGLYSPYNYVSSVTLPTTSVDYGANVSGASLTTARLSGEYYFGEKWGIGAGVDYTQALFALSTSNYTASRNTYEITAKYRTSLSPEKGWFFAPKFGIEYRNIPDIVAGGGSSATVMGVNVLGPSIGFDLRKQLGPKFGLGVKVSYFLPLLGSLSDPSNSAQQFSLQPFSALNLSIGAQGLYWLGPRWGLGAGGFYDLRGVSAQVTATTNPPSGGPATTSLFQNTVNMNSFNLFMSVIYSLTK